MPESEITHDSEPENEKCGRVNEQKKQNRS